MRNLEENNVSKELENELGSRLSRGNVGQTMRKIQSAMTTVANTYFGKVEQKMKEEWYDTKCKETLKERN